MTMADIIMFILSWLFLICMAVGVLYWAVQLFRAIFSHDDDDSLGESGIIRIFIKIYPNNQQRT